MKLEQILETTEVVEIVGAVDIEIEGLSHDSRHIKPGWLFVAIKGGQADGADFIPGALSNGAVAVVSECAVDTGSGVTHVLVSDARRALAEIANAYYGELSQQIKVVGVTGTNGKTTTAYMIRDVLRSGGHQPGLLGTVAYEIGERIIPASRTTPEAPDIHSMFQQMKDTGCDSAVMEVSSHAIDLQRVHGINFAYSVFTNLTQDHLDYHEDMDTYFNVKARLFEQMDKEHNRAAIINIDDPWGRKLVEEGTIEVDMITYGFNEQAMVCASDAKVGGKGARFHVSTPWGEADIALKLLGRFNIYNALAALAVGCASGIDLPVVVESLETITSVPGRLELVPNRKHRRIFIDYAHTDDALRNVLTTLREICKGRLIVIFGCGGDRDREKRSKMGQVAAELADYSIITSDNPRSEDPEQIIADVAAGFTEEQNFEVVSDRRAAIETGLRKMKLKDVLLVAGKGHETYQVIGQVVVPFSDREVIREIIG